MKIYIYNGSGKIVGKSGVGKAVQHQQMILKMQGIETENISFKEADIVHINNIFPNSVMTAIRAHIHHKKVIYYGHSTMEDFKNSFKFTNFTAPLFKQWLKFCYRRGDVIITPTEYSKNLLMSYGIPRKIYALSNGIDTDFWSEKALDGDAHAEFRKKYGLSPDSKVVISVGLFIERKGITEFINIAGRYPDVQFIWFGYTKLSLIPEKTAEAIRTAPGNVHFPGYVEENVLREAYLGCDLFCFMSHEENEGIVILEALSCGTPIIVRDIPVYDGWLEDRKNVYKCTGQDQFAGRIEDMLTGKLPALTEEGKKVALERSYDKIGRRMIEIYKELLNL